MMMVDDDEIVDDMEIVVDDAADDTGCYIHKYTMTMVEFSLWASG